MTTARVVPVTTVLDGDQLDAEDACTCPTGSAVEPGGAGLTR
ncbi:MAG: hypothetical protein ABIQ59_14530 [Nocardioidaceae bacterium]